MLNVLSSTAYFIWPAARRGKTGDWCWRHPELKLGDGFRPGSSTFKTQQVQRLTVFKQKFHPQIIWSPQTFEELQKAQFDWLHWALTHPWYKLLTSESYLKKCDLYRSEDHQIRAGFWEGPDAGRRQHRSLWKSRKGFDPSRLANPSKPF